MAESKVSEVFNCTSVHAPTELSIFSATVGAIYSPITVVGNALVILAIVIDPYKELRSPFNFLLVNLAVADLIIGLLIDPLSAVAHTNEAQGKSNQDMMTLVKFVHFMYFVSVTASVLNLSALSIDRFVAIRFPLKYRANATAKRNVAVFGAIWSIAFITSAFYFRVGYVSMTMIMAGISITFTVIVMISTSILVYLTVSQRQENLQYKRHTSNTTKEVDRKHEMRMHNASQAIQNRKLLTVLILMLVAFLVCFIPNATIIYYLNFTVGNCILRHWLRDLQFLFAITSSLLNPFIYTWRMPLFRKAILALVRKRKANRIAFSSSSDVQSTANSKRIAEKSNGFYLQEA